MLQGPIWVGEFGPVYAFPQDGYDNWQEINDTRYDVAKSQIDIYDKAKASWAIWMYKGENSPSHDYRILRADIGFQGLVNIGENTAWMKLIGPFNERKKVCRYARAELRDSAWPPINGAWTIRKFDIFSSLS